MREGKEIVVDITGMSNPAGVIEEAAALGVTRAISRGEVDAGEGHVSIMRATEEGGPGRACWVPIEGPGDVEKALNAALSGSELVVAECTDWKVIPLENLVAEFQRAGKRLFAYVDSVQDARLALSILERGVDGVVVPHKILAQAVELLGGGGSSLELVRARITRIEDVGLGERVCVDTATQLAQLEGMLVGSSSRLFFLVHGETIPSNYIPTRPFRVNAGAIHSYTLLDCERTSYLSELEAGSRVALVDATGRLREAVVGRVKIERRPLVLLEASAEGSNGTVMLQKAETIRLVKGDRTPVAVTELAIGDQVLVHRAGPQGRHFGGRVEEYIIER